MALERGTTPGSIFADLRRVAHDIDVPLIAMTYFNIVFRIGPERFAAEAAAAGIDAVILPDVPMEELGEWAPAARSAGLETVLLASPIATEARLTELCRRSEGFVYGVNLLGVTGERVSVGEQAGGLARRLKALTDKPVVMGFGISTPEQAATVATAADGVVMASALMRLVLDGADAERVADLLEATRAALDLIPASA
ncbi:MAG: tryptophan synthase subunit alpha [Acidimicrobiales bacterium]